MKQSKEFVKEFMNINLYGFSKKNIKFKVDIINESEFEKNILGMKWTNICIDELGNISSYLSVNYREQDREWNKVVDDVTRNIIPLVEPKIIFLLKKNIINKKIAQKIKLDFVHMGISKAYSEYYKSNFFEEMLTLYKSGYIPCGWVGKYPKGTYKVI